MKKTPWFPVSIKPVRVGLYEFKYSGLPSIYDRTWDGKKWHDLYSPFSLRTGDTWRGLAKETTK